MAQYLKPDTELGYVEDSAEIENLKVNNMRHVVLGCMLGDFDEVGSYVVDDEVKQELIEMDKYIVETFDNIEFCRSELKLDKQISFMVTFEGNRARLALIEKIQFEGNFKLNSGTYSNVNEYVLDSVETSGEINRAVIYARWHIKPLPSQIIDIFSCDEAMLAKYFGIVKRFKYLLAANKTLLEKEAAMEEIEAGYVNEIFSILNHYPILKKNVLENLNKTLSEKKNAVSVKKPFFAKTLNEVVENVIDQNLGVLNEQEKQNFLSEKHNALLRMNVKRDEVIEAERFESKKDEQAVLCVKTDEQYENKSIQELSELFVGQHHQTTDRLNGKDTNLFLRALARNGNEMQTYANKETLMEILEELGIAELVGVEKGDVKVEPVAEQQAVVKQPEPSKAKAAAKTAGGSAVKHTSPKTPGPEKSKSAAKKSAAAKPQNNNPKKETAIETSQKPRERTMYVGDGGAKQTGNQVDNEYERYAADIIRESRQAKQNLSSNLDTVKATKQTVDEYGVN